MTPTLSEVLKRDAFLCQKRHVGEHDTGHVFVHGARERGEEGGEKALAKPMHV